MVTRKERRIINRGYGMNSSDDDLKEDITTDCSCNFGWTLDRRQKLKKERDLIADTAIFHEHIHHMRDEVEKYITETSVPYHSYEDIQEEFNHIPKGILDHILEWMTTTVSKFWIRNKTEKLFNNGFDE